MPGIFHPTVVKHIQKALDDAGFFISNKSEEFQISLIDSMTDGRMSRFKRRVFNTGNYFCPFDFLTVYTISSCGGNVKRSALSGLPAEILLNIAQSAFLDCEDHFEAPGDVIDVIVEERYRVGRAIRRSSLKPLNSVEPYYRKGSFIVVYINCQPSFWYPCTAYVLTYPRDIDIDLRGASFISCPADIAIQCPHIQDSWMIHDTSFSWSDSYRFLDLMSRTKNAHVRACTDFSPLLTNAGEILEPFYFLESSSKLESITEEDCEPNLSPINWKDLNDTSDEDSD